MSKFRKRPVVIDAMKFDDQADPGVLAKWCAGSIVVLDPATSVREHLKIEIPTLEGTMTASFGDYIIRGVQGEFYPCKPDIFEATYVPHVVFLDDGSQVEAL